MSSVGLRLLVGLAIGAALVVLGGDGSVVRDVGSATLVAVGPIALAAALVASLTHYVGPIERKLRARSEEPPNGAEAFALGLAAALAVLALGALALSALGVELRPAALRWWLVGADALSVALCWSVTVQRRLALSWPGGLSAGLATAGSILLLGGALAAGIVITAPPRPAAGIAGYTSLGLSPVGRTAATVEIQNWESSTKTYRLTFGESHKARSDVLLTLRPGQVWSRRVDLAPSGARPEHLPVALYSPPTSATPYRSTYLDLGTP
jgi:hypothetical protein